MSDEPQPMGDGPEEKPKPWANGLAVMNAGRPLAALEGDASPILARLGAGETTKQIADSYGIALPALYQWLLRNCPEQWASASAGLALARIDKGEAILDDDNLGTNPKVDGVIVSRARASIASAQWTVERVARKMYGDTKGNGDVAITVVIDRSCGVTVIIPKDSTD